MGFCKGSGEQRDARAPRERRPKRRRRAAAGDAEGEGEGVTDGAPDVEGGEGAGQLDQGQLTLMEATVNCAPFETFVNGTATPRYD